MINQCPCSFFITKHLSFILYIQRKNSPLHFIKMPFRATNFNRGSSSLAQFKKRQADFQCDNGQPIWLKGGLCDKILYGSTIVACYIGILMTLGTIYDNAKPASWKTPSC